MLNFVKKRIRKVFFRNMESYEISYEELLQMQKQGAIVVDVRSSQEYQEGHVDGAINIPEYQISEKVVQNILKDKSAKIILYCSYGKRSKKAYKKLIDLGYLYVFSLYEGIESI